MSALDRVVDQLTAVPLARLDPDLRRHVRQYERRTGRRMSVFELPSGEVFVIEHAGRAPSREKLLAALRARVFKDVAPAGEA